MSQPRPQVVAVVGATATGKSDLGVELARTLGGAVINADASQLYRGMDIGTAKLTPAQRQGVAHHQLDVLDLHEDANVAAYQRNSRADIEAVLARGGVPVVVGGSGLYLRAALDHLEIPPTDPQVRSAWEERLQQEGASALHALLARRDPAAAASILPTNGRRVVRALEVVELTGRPFSATMPTRQSLRPTLFLGLAAPRPVLAERIETRVRRMWAQGLLAEVEELAARGLREAPTASRAIGYAQALAQLDARLDQQQAQDATAAATRRLVKRQELWFRPDPRIAWLPHDAPDLRERALAMVGTGRAGPRGAQA